MKEFACLSCRQIFRSRLRSRLVQLQHGRRRLHASFPLHGDSRYAESWYWHTKPPTHQELAAAHHFFKYNWPSREWTGETWRRQGDQNQTEGLLIPEVIFLGRSNVGKSSLINALAGRDLNRVSATPGATKAMAAWTLAAKTASGGAIKGWDGDVSPKVSLVDMPGYGFGSSTQWGGAILSYLVQRKNIRRAFLLVDAVHGVVGTDRHIMEILRGLAIPYQLVATKCDRLVAFKGSQSEVRSALTNIRAQAKLDENQELGLGEIISVGSLHAATATKRAQFELADAAFGVQNIKWAVLRAVGLDAYAMQKASAHGVLKDIEAEEQVSLQIHEEAEVDRDRLQAFRGQIQRPGDDVSVSDETSQPASSSQDSKPSFPDLAVEDFIREILNAKPASSTKANDGGKKQQTAKVFHAISQPTPQSPEANRGTTASGGYDPNGENFLADSDASRAEQAIDAAMDYIKQEGAEHRRSAVNSITDAATKGSRPRRRNITASVAGNMASLSTPIKASNSPQPASDAKENMFGRSFQPLSEPNRPRQPRNAKPSTSGVGVLRGMDAFEAMLDQQSSSKTKRTRRGGKSSKRAGPAGRQPNASLDQQSRQPAPLPGKGVTQGMDAFEAMFAADDKSGSKRRRRRS